MSRAKSNAANTRDGWHSSIVISHSDAISYVHFILLFIYVLGCDIQLRYAQLNCIRCNLHGLGGYTRCTAPQCTGTWTLLLSSGFLSHKCYRIHLLHGLTSNGLRFMCDTTRPLIIWSTWTFEPCVVLDHVRRSGSISVSIYKCKQIVAAALIGSKRWECECDANTICANKLYKKKFNETNNNNRVTPGQLRWRIIMCSIIWHMRVYLHFVNWFMSVAVVMVCDSKNIYWLRNCEIEFLHCGWWRW